MQKLKTPLLLIGVFVMSFLVGYLVLAWTEPTVLPPGDNTETPLNVSATGQTKTGGLTIGTGGSGVTAPAFYDYNDTSYYVNPSSTTLSAALAGSVGIGTTAPVEKLEIVEGNIKLSSNCANRYLHFYDTGRPGQLDWRIGHLAGGSDDLVIDFDGVRVMTLEDFSGNVGIATLTPNYKLDVVGQANATELCIAGDCRTSWPSGASLWAQSGSDIYYTVGNVGIGTTSPKQDLHVNGTQLRISGADDNGIEFMDAADEVDPTAYGLALIYETGFDELRVKKLPLSTDITLFSVDRDTEYGYFKGNVGIGTFTPVEKLQVAGSVNIDNRLFLRDGSGWGGNPKISLAIGDCDTGLDWVSDGNLAVYSNNVERMRLTDAGFLGIGTTTPEKRLTIQGTDTDWNNATGGQVKLINPGSCCSSLTIQSTSAGGKTYSIMSTGSGATAGPGALAFYSNTDLSYRMVIDPTGNVGIGTTNPTRKLDVVGIINTSAGYSVAGNGGINASESDFVPLEIYEITIQGGIITYINFNPPCLEEGSLVLTPTSFKPIETLSVGDKVIGYKDGQNSEAEVTKITTHEGDFTLYKYKGYWFTGNHKVYTDLGNLKRVDELSDITKEYTGTIYDIKVADTENYFGENNLLIHNK